MSKKVDHDEINFTQEMDDTAIAYLTMGNQETAIESEDVENDREVEQLLATNPRGGIFGFFRKQSVNRKKRNMSEQ